MATPLQCSCLENPRDGGAWWAAVYRVAPPPFLMFLVVPDGWGWVMGEGWRGVSRHGPRSPAPRPVANPSLILESDRGIGGVRPVAPPTWLVSNFLVRPASS